MLPWFQRELNLMLGFCANRVLFNGGLHKQRVANQILHMLHWYNL